MSENEQALGQDCFSEAWGDEAGGIVADERGEEPLPEDNVTAEDGAGNETGGTGAPVLPIQEPGVDPAARKRDLELFVRTYPGVRPQDVPGEVWERAKKGESLVTAYMRYESGTLRRENERLRREAETRARDEQNRVRAAGSQLGAGTGICRRDPFEDGWEDAF